MTHYHFNTGKGLRFHIRY